MDVSGSNHAPVSSLAEVTCSTHWTWGWIDPRAGPAGNSSQFIHFIVGKKLKTVRGPWFEGCLCLHAYNFMSTLVSLIRKKSNSSKFLITLPLYFAYCRKRDEEIADVRNCEACHVLLIQTPLSESARELYWHSDRRLSAKLVPTFADRGCHVVSVTDPYVRILGFLDRSRHYFFQVAPQLYSRGWVDPVPDPVLLRKSGSAGIEPGPLDLQPGTLTTRSQRRSVLLISQQNHDSPWNFFLGLHFPHPWRSGLMHSD
jgi:hypothetical protein